MPISEIYSAHKQDFDYGDQRPLAAFGEENFENLTTKWCILI